MRSTSNINAVDQPNSSMPGYVVCSFGAARYSRIFAIMLQTPGVPTPKAEDGLGPRRAAA
jgi:hypothetical protein